MPARFLVPDWMLGLAGYQTKYLLNLALMRTKQHLITIIAIILLEFYRTAVLILMYVIEMNM